MASEGNMDKHATVLYKAISDIAAMSDYPPAPMHYESIQRSWKRMVMTARRAKEKVDKSLAEIPR